jgi:hypothetical protein
MSWVSLRSIRQARGCTHHLSLRDELGRVELGDDALQDFVADGWEDPLIIVQTQALVYPGKLFDVWSGKHSKSDRDHLQVFGACRRGYVLRESWSERMQGKYL